MESDVNSTCSINVRKWTAIEKPWGQGYVVLVKQYKMAEHFTRFAKRKKLPNYYLKLMQEQEEYKSTNDICYLENICRSKYSALIYSLASLPIIAPTAGSAQTL